MSDVKRYGSISRLTPEKADYYKKLHAAPWKQINDMIKECNIRNYSIYCHGEYLFSYYEYTGDNYEADMAKMAADSETQRVVGRVRAVYEPAIGRRSMDGYAGNLSFRLEVRQI